GVEPVCKIEKEISARNRKTFLFSFALPNASACYPQLVTRKLPYAPSRQLSHCNIGLEHLIRNQEFNSTNSQTCYRSTSSGASHSTKAASSTPTITARMSCLRFMRCNDARVTLNKPAHQRRQKPGR